MLHAVLDAGLVAHVGVVDESGQPYVLPVAYARDGDQVLFHGSTGSRLFRALAAGAPTCLTVTLLDGLVVARSAFESSMHYRGVMVLGTCTVVSGTAKREALKVITEHLMPGRWDDVRAPHTKEVAATTILSPVPRRGLGQGQRRGAGRPRRRLAGRAWAGTVPLVSSYGPAVPAANLAAGIERPAYVETWTP